MCSSFSFYSKNKVLGYSTRNRKFKHLEPHFRTSATRPAPKEDTKNAVALVCARECAEELESGLLKFGSMETFVATVEQKTKNPREKTAADVLPLSILSGRLAILAFCRGECNTGGPRSLFSKNYCWSASPPSGASNDDVPSRQNNILQPSIVCCATKPHNPILSCC